MAIQASNSSSLVMQWHPTKNGDAKPEHFTAESSWEAWWICLYEHEWKCGIREMSRFGSSCPTCEKNREQLLVDARTYAFVWTIVFVLYCSYAYYIGEEKINLFIEKVFPNTGPISFFFILIYFSIILGGTP